MLELAFDKNSLNMYNKNHKERMNVVNSTTKIYVYMAAKERTCHYYVNKEIQ